MTVDLSEGELQRFFPLLVAKLIQWADAHGYQLTFGEAWRTPQQAAWDVAHGTGILHSLHIERLAIDFNLFKDGIWQTDAEAFRPLADFWKTLHPLCRWGGDFKTVDGDHFSLEFQGRA
jgi:hypothetical protein